MSDTKNVKLGVCKVFYDNVDLGYTQGGVDVTVKTETHKVNVDQFGKTTINETHDAEKAVGIKMVKDGKITFVTTVLPQ